MINAPHRRPEARPRPARPVRGWRAPWGERLAAGRGTEPALSANPEPVTPRWPRALRIAMIGGGGVAAWGLVILAVWAAMRAGGHGN